VPVQKPDGSDKPDKPDGPESKHEGMGTDEAMPMLTALIGGGKSNDSGGGSLKDLYESIGRR